MQNTMSVEEVESLLQQGTIEQIVHNMEKEQANAFLKTVYETVKQPEFYTGGTIHYDYMGFDGDKREIHGHSFNTVTVSPGEVSEDIGSEDKLSFEEAEKMLREKLTEEKTDSKTR